MADATAPTVDVERDAGEAKGAPRSRQGSVRPSLAPEAHATHIVLDKCAISSA